MIINNTSLGFGSQNEEDCRNDNFCQSVVKQDNPVWQIVSECDEITGGTKKMPCESNLIGDYTDSLGRYEGNDKVETLDGSVIIGPNSITLINAGAPANIISTPEGFLEPNKCYFLRFSVVNYDKGFIQPTTTETGEAIKPDAATSSGTYTRQYCTDELGRLRFQFALTEGEETTSLTLTNIFIGCIRYSNLYDIDYPEGEEGSFSFAGQTMFEKTEVYIGDIDINLIDTSKLIIGKRYRFCITLQDCTAGQITVTIGDDTFTYSTNGRFCEEVVFAQAVLPNVFKITAKDFAGKFGDIEITPIAEIKAGLFDCDGNEIENGLSTEIIENTLKVSLGENVEDGCYTIGVADSCSNFRSQFYGNVFDSGTRYSNGEINIVTGEFLPIFPVEDLWQNRIKFIDVLCCEKLYSGTFHIRIFDDEDFIVLDSFRVIINLGGNIYSKDYVPNNPIIDRNLFINFTDIEAGCENSDIEVVLEYKYSGPMWQGFMFLNDGSTFINMNEGQFCPEKQSRCIKISTEPSCSDPSVLIKYRNNQDAFGFNYTSPGYTETDGFFNQLRIPAKVWKASFPKTKEINRDSTGKRNIYYSDVDKKFVLNVNPIPEPLHEALSIALEHDIFQIDDVEYVCESTDYEPEWNKNSATAPVEIELFAQIPRKLKTLC